MPSFVLTAAKAAQTAADSPALFGYLTAIGAFLLVLSQALPRLFGPFGKWIENWQKNRQRASAEAPDVERDDLRRQLEYAERELSDLRREAETARRQAQIHVAWDYAALDELRSNGRQWADPPSLWRSYEGDNK